MTDIGDLSQDLEGQPADELLDCAADPASGRGGDRHVVIYLLPFEVLELEDGLLAEPTERLRAREAGPDVA